MQNKLTKNRGKMLFYVVATAAIDHNDYYEQTCEAC